MENEKIIFWRNFLLRTLLIGILFAILTFVLLAAFRNTWEMWVANIFGIEKKELGKLVLNFFMNVRLVLVFLFLSPAIALHWMSKKTK
jgi:hypothetical protein